MKCPACGHKWKMGPAPRVSDEDLIAALTECSGNKVATAERLGMKIANCGTRLRKLGFMGKRGPRPRPNFTREDLVNALEVSGGLHKYAAKILGVCVQTIQNRMVEWNMPPLPQRRRRHASIEVLNAIARNDGNMAAAAKDLKISRERVRQIASEMIVKFQNEENGKETP